MNRETIKQKLLAGETVFCDYLHFSERQSYCWSTIDWWNGEVDNDCCLNDYKDVEVTLDEIESMCKGNWEEVV